MTTKELINTGIEKLSEGELKKVYVVVRSLAESKTGKHKASFMSRLKRIQIDAPEDFDDAEDLKAFQSRAREPNLDFDNVVRSLKRRGKL